MNKKIFKKISNKTRSDFIFNNFYKSQSCEIICPRIKYTSKIIYYFANHRKFKFKNNISLFHVSSCKCHLFYKEY